MKNIFDIKSCYSRIALRRSLVCFAIVFVSIILHQISFAQSQQSVSEILDGNGKIRSGINGSFNATGYALGYGENKEPILTKSNSLQKVSTITWSALGLGVYNGGMQVRAVAVKGSDVYVGGDFSTAGSSSANHIAKWNGSAWSALGTGLNGAVYAIAISDSGVYVTGNFTTAGIISASGIARWNPAGSGTWSALGSGLVPNVGLAIAVRDSIVYVGGGFTQAGGISTNYLAKWNVITSTWSAFGNSLNTGIASIAVSDSFLYVGGYFTVAGGSSGNYITKWKFSTSTWSALGTGMNGSVLSLAICDSGVYAGGTFTTAGGSSANRTAKWNGTSWSALGTGLDNEVYAIAASGSDLYVGGVFSTADGNPASRIAKWNGIAWSPLGGGLNSGGVLALAVNVSAGAMMVGGGFTLVDGTNVSATDIAKFTDSNNPLPVELTKISARINGSSVLLNWQTGTEVNNFGFDIERRTNPLSPPSQGGDERGGWTKAGFVEGAGTTNSPKEYSYTDNNLKAGQYVYRLKQIDRDGKFSYSRSVEVEIGVVPKEFSLSQNYPNPFNPSTVISYQLPVSSYVTLKVFDALGREIATLVNEVKEAGKYEVKFSAVGGSASGGDAFHLSSGIYFYRLHAGNVVLVKKMLMIK